MSSKKESDVKKKPAKAPAKKKATKKKGRPSKYSNALAKKICLRMMSGESLRSICRDPKMPVISTVMLWLVDDKHQFFSEQYAKARKVQAEILADEIFDVSDDARNDWMEREDPDNPGFNLNGEAVARSRLRVDSRKWYLSKIVPRFADKVQLEHSADDKLLEALKRGRKRSGKE